MKLGKVPQDIQEMYEMYLDGDSLKDIADSFTDKFAKSTIKMYFDKYGLPIRSRKQAVKVHWKKRRKAGSQQEEVR